MRLIRPDAETLRAYVYEELSEEDAAGVRRWLVACADEGVLSEYEALLEERRRNETVLEHWSTRPVLARLDWLWAKLRRRPQPHGEAWRSSGLARPAELAALGRSGVAGAKPVLEVSPGEMVDLEVRTAVPCYVGAYALESSGAVASLTDPARRVAAGEPLPLDGFSLSAQEGDLEVFIVFDTRAPLPGPGKDSGAEWLVALLDSVESNPERSVVRRTVRLAGAPGSGKQT